MIHSDLLQYLHSTLLYPKILFQKPAARWLIHVHAHQPQLCKAKHEKRKEKTMPFGVNSMRSPAL